MSQPDSSSDDAARGILVEKPRANVYTAMLVLSFIALVIGCLCLGAEMKQYDWQKSAQSAGMPG